MFSYEYCEILKRKAFFTEHFLVAVSEKSYFGSKKKVLSHKPRTAKFVDFMWFLRIFLTDEITYLEDVFQRVDTCHSDLNNQFIKKKPSEKIYSKTQWQI